MRRPAQDPPAAKLLLATVCSFPYDCRGRELTSQFVSPRDALAIPSFFSVSRCAVTFIRIGLSATGPRRSLHVDCVIPFFNGAGRDYANKVDDNDMQRN
jgi:hypothetical protein